MTETRQNLHEVYMAMALEESRKALPQCLPNPPVGCVLVRNGSVIAKGRTHAPGSYHAEAHALSQVGGSLEDVDAYVTLEPCSFEGRTPSCAKALIKSRIRSVTVALIDPHPENRGCGINMIEEARISVKVGVLEKEVGNFISAYLLNGDT